MEKILIIEDDELIADLERDYLLAEGMEAEIASDGNMGLLKFKKDNYDAVILDLMLPGKMDSKSAGKYGRNQIFRSFWSLRRKKILIRLKAWDWEQMICGKAIQSYGIGGQSKGPHPDSSVTEGKKEGKLSESGEPGNLSRVLQGTKERQSFRAYWPGI